MYKKVKVATASNSRTLTTDNKKRKSTAPQKPETRHIESKKEKEVRDPFLINTNMSKDEKKQFLDYIKEIAHQAKEKYGNDKNKINHAIANAIAYPVYRNDLLQSNVNDFGNKPSVKNYNDVEDLLTKIYKYDKYRIDFPHLATTIASAEDSGKGKSIIKWIAGLSIGNLWGNSPKDNFFQQNSLTGDLLSNIDDKDEKSDIDAIIFHYHPDFKDLTFDEAIIKYYHMENLDVERERLYKEVLELQAGKGVTGEEQELLNIFSAIASFGGLGLIIFTLLKKGRKELKEFMESPSKYGSAILAGIGSGAKLFAKDPLKFIGTKVLGPISNLLADSISLGGRIINILGKKLYYNAFEPIVKFVNKNVIQPINKNIVKPIFKHVVKPVLSFAEKKILKPVVQKVIKPTIKFVNKKIIQPIKNKIIKPVVKFVGNKIVKPVIKKVIKPAAKYVHKI